MLLPFTLRYSFRFFLVALTLICILNTNILAQPAIEWDKTLGGINTSGGDNLAAVIQTSDGGYFLAGSSNGSINEYKTEPSRGLYDFWVTKISSDGTRQWDKTYGGSKDDLLTCAIPTADGGYLLGGKSSSDISGEKSANDYISLGSPGIRGDYWIVKISADGTKQWDKTYGGTLTDNLASIAQTSDGGYLLGGSSVSSRSGDKSQRPIGDLDYWVIKITADGTKLWDKTLGDITRDELSEVRQTSDGDYLVAGTSAYIASDDKTQNPRGYFVIKFAPDGTKKWSKVFGGDRSDQLSSVALTPDGGCLLGGTSNSGISGDKTEKALGQSGLSDYWVVKITSDGRKEWEKTIGGYSEDKLYSVQLTTDGGYILGGVSLSNVGADKLAKGRGLGDYWLVKISATGQKLWDKGLGTTTPDELQAVIQTQDGGFLAAGFAGGGATIDSDKTQLVSIVDFWVVKLLPEASTKQLSFSQSAITFNMALGDTPETKSVTLSANTGSPAVIISKPTNNAWLTLPTSMLGTLPFTLIEPQIPYGTGFKTIAIAVAPGYARAILGVTLNTTIPGPTLTFDPIGNKTAATNETIAFTAHAQVTPAQNITYYLGSEPAGAKIEGNTGVFTWTPTTPGNYTFRVNVLTGGPQVLTGQQQVTISVRDRINEPIRINAGGSAYTSTDGRQFIGDDYFGGDLRTSSIPNGDILNTTDDVLYRTGRCSPAFNYTIPVENGSFIVVLHFAETWFGIPLRGPAGVGRRQFHVDLEGSRKLTNYDIYAQAGGAMKAIQETFEVQVTDGFLNINFTSGLADLPRVSAIEVIGPDELTKITVAPLADAYVHDGSFATTNYGNDQALEAKNGIGNSVLRSSYLKFPLNGVTQVTVAKLRFYGYNHEVNRLPSVPLSVLGVNDDSWTENGITWNNAPAGVGTALGAVDIVGSDPKYYEVDITSFIQAELAGDKTASILLKDLKSVNCRLIFHSKESGSSAPELILYTNSPLPSASRIGQETFNLKTAETIEKSVVYPNPIRKSFTLNVASQHDKDLSVQLISEVGKAYKLDLPENTASGSKAEIDITKHTVSSGVYLIKVKSSTFSETHKVLIVD